jgi:hypothetical protein
MRVHLGQTMSGVHLAGPFQRLLGRNLRKIDGCITAPARSAAKEESTSSNRYRYSRADV